MRNLSVRLSEDQIKDLKQLAKNEDRSISYLIRLSINNLIKNKKKCQK